MSMQLTKKFNLIYIVSIGHSGSTLLESILGAHSQVTTSGEIQIWPHEIQHDTMPCACGKAISECEFWSELKVRVNPLEQPYPQINLFREKHNAGHTIRLSEIGKFRNKTNSRKQLLDIQQYALNNLAIYREFCHLMEEKNGKQIKWIVDSSKDPYRLLWLVKSDLFNIKVLHVIKNPRAFVYSMLKRIPKEDKTKIHSQIYESARQSFKWSFENYLASLIANNFLSAHEYRLVRYETMASKPEVFFVDLFEFLDIDFEQEALTDFRKKAMHTIAGNPMRYRKDGIKLDEAWKKDLQSYNAFVADVMSFTTKSRYGY